MPRTLEASRKVPRIMIFRPFRTIFNRDTPLGKIVKLSFSLGDFNASQYQGIVILSFISALTMQNDIFSDFSPLRTSKIPDP